MHSYSGEQFEQQQIAHLKLWRPEGLAQQFLSSEKERTIICGK